MRRFYRRKTKAKSKWRSPKRLSAETIRKMLAEMREQLSAAQKKHAELSARSVNIQLLRERLQAEIASYKKKLEAVRSHPASRKHAFRAFFSGSPFTEQAQQQMGALQSLIDSKLSAIPQDDDRAIWLVTYEISQLRKAIAEYESALAPHIKREERRKEEQRKKQVQKQQIEELRAAAASSHEKTRELGARVRNRLAKQSQCPYCGGALGPSPHADHIYPVSKGGRSVERNMVMVCASCNIKKAHLTLSAFIKTYQLNRDEIEARLTVLEKDF